MLGKNRGKTRNVKPTKTITLRNPQPSRRSQDEATKLLMKMSYPKIPNKVGDELSFSQFAAPVEPQLMRDVLKCKIKGYHIRNCHADYSQSL
jgi:hypothetical protein